MAELNVDNEIALGVKTPGVEISQRHLRCIQAACYNQILGIEMNTSEYIVTSTKFILEAIQYRFVSKLCIKRHFIRSF